MGLTLRCKKTNLSMDMGYGGFMRLRNKVAELIGEPFASHELQLSTGRVISLYGEERDRFYEKFNAETERMIKRRQVSIKMVHFLHQSDCGGSIRYGACAELLRIIGDYDDNVYYGYVGHGDNAKWSRFVAILRDCVANKCDMVWD